MIVVGMLERMIDNLKECRDVESDIRFVGVGGVG